ncbi:MAG: hypothetical protein P0116_08235 [Candidatus Nitrosocosmicus sp.]|nr:hypothetical protein [Candidatus Nitrosocosmicus sp.]
MKAITFLVCGGACVYLMLPPTKKIQQRRRYYKIITYKRDQHSIFVDIGDCVTMINQKNKNN